MQKIFTHKKGAKTCDVLYRGKNNLKLCQWHMEFHDAPALCPVDTSGTHRKIAKSGCCKMEKTDGWTPILA